ncbi:MAG: flagellar biosynthesis protein FlhA [Actinomycetota bacterium]
MERSRLGQVTLPGAVVLVVAVMVIPLPSPILDVLIVANLSTSILILLVSMNVRRALDFSSFPSLLLVVTLFRLGLNVATSRAVLSNGHAGEVIATFGSVVVGGSLVVGLVIFLILTLVQFVVISNGSGRVAEVTARFTLDAMPGKQMAIDADLSAGAIGEEEARSRRREVADEADFYGAMDGASKFVKGDAIAGLVITMVNLIGGFLIGVVQMGMPVTDAIAKYSLLTVGDGLVSQIPALLVSISAGLIVTRSAGGADLGSDVFAQFRKQRSAMRAAGVVVLLMGAIPGLPKVPFLLLGVLLVMIANRLPLDDELEREAMPAVTVEDAGPPSPQQLAVDSRVEPLELNIAFDLIGLVDGTSGGDLLDRVGALRRKIASELGFVMPSIRTRDSGELPSNTYAISVHGVEVGRGTAPLGRVLVIGDSLVGFPGEDTREPVFGLAARWVPAEYQVQAEIAGHTVVDRSTLIVTHLAEIVRRRAGRLLSRSDVKVLVDGVRTTDPQVVDDLNTAGVTIGEVQRVLAGLLDDGVPIRDLVRILEAIGDRARTSRTIESMVEAARGELGPAISSALAPAGRFAAVTLSASTEHRLMAGLRTFDGVSQLELAPDDADTMIRTLAELVSATAVHDSAPVLVCSAPLRPALSKLIKTTVPGVNVVSYSEIGDHLHIDVVANVDLNAAADRFGSQGIGSQPMNTYRQEKQDEYAAAD